jgi:flagellar hook-associated protein 3 FlgL
MTSRIGDLAQHRLMSTLMLGTQARMRETQAQLGSGKRADRFRDIAAEADRLLSAKDVLRRNERYVHNNNIVDARLEVMEDATSSLIEIGDRLRTLLIQRLNSASAVPETLAVEAEQLLEEAVNQLNTSFAGRHLFAGSRTDAAPVALDPAFADFGQPDDTYYRGDEVVLSVRADDDVEIGYGVTADAQGFRQLIGALRGAIEADRSLDDGLLEESLGLANRALGDIEDRRSEIGARRGMLERANTAHEDARLLLQSVVGGVEDVDLAEAVTRLAQHQVALQAAMMTLSRLQDLSLANYLR